MKLVSSIVILSFAVLAGSAHAETTSPPVSSIKASKKINLNQASVEELLHTVKGIGQKRAQAIIQYREQHGPFKSLTDLAAVHGIGPRFVEKNRDALEQKFVW